MQNFDFIKKNKQRGSVQKAGVSKTSPFYSIPKGNEVCNRKEIHEKHHSPLISSFLEKSYRISEVGEQIRSELISGSFRTKV